MNLPQDMLAHNRQVIADFRANGGVEPGRNLLLLTTTGARTGEERTSPMMFVPDGDRILVIASNAGAVHHPNWYHNLVAHPDVTVEVTGDTYRARALPLEGEERERTWASITGQFAFFLDHQAKIERTIPIVALERTSQ
jgi:deazaflavin-dependent oxidoreductase (nitroreductase family)